MSRNSQHQRSSSSKRRRSRSHDYERHKLRKISPTPSTSLHLEENFSFEHYKRDLNKIILYSSESNTVANSLDDFWVFVKKYEATLKKAGKPIIDLSNGEKLEFNSIGAPKNFSKFHCINISTKLKYTEIFSDERDRKKLDKNLFEAFLNVVSIYLDFKNKEKFEKLKKLRQAQKELPVAKYRWFIIY